MSEFEMDNHRAHHQKVQSNIDEIIRNQPDKRLMQIELQAVIDGYNDYLVRHGFGGLEIPMILSKLDFNPGYIN